MGRRILNRKELRDQNDAYERTKDEEVAEDEDVEEDEDDEEEEDEEEGGEDAEGTEEDDADEDADDEGDDDDDEDGPKKKKKKKVAAKKPAKAKAPAKPRKSRAAKVVRMRVVWGVFSNSNQCVATYEYPRKAEAEAHVAKLIADKKSTHFLQPVKEPMPEEKKEK